MRILLCLIILIAVCSFVATPGAVIAQTVTVQQPVIETFSVPATVVVPDRGEALLGGIKTAREARKTFGPGGLLFHPGSSAGRELKQSTASVRATIHAHNEMDFALLNKPIGSPALPFEKSKRPSHYLKNYGGTTIATNPAMRNQRKPTVATHGMPRLSQDRFPSRLPGKTFKSPPLLKQGDVAKRISQTYLKQGAKAERQGNRSLAKIYYRLAKQNGSLKAKQLLQLLESASGG